MSKISSKDLFWYHVLYPAHISLLYKAVVDSTIKNTLLYWKQSSVNKALFALRLYIFSATKNFLFAATLTLNYLYRSTYSKHVCPTENMNNKNEVPKERG